MGFLETLIVGGYVYTTGVFVWFTRKLDALAHNHLKHLVDKAVKEALLARSQVDVSSERSDIIDSVD